MSAKNEKKVELSYWKNQEKPKEGEIYTDSLFPPNQNSLDPSGSLINNSKVEFLRASEIYKGSRYVLISDKMDMNDIVPGELDNSYFLSSVQNLCKAPSNINRLFKTKIYIGTSLNITTFLLINLNILSNSGNLSINNSTSLASFSLSFEFTKNS